MGRYGSSSDSPSLGSILGIVFGLVFGSIFICAGIYCCARTRRRRVACGPRSITRSREPTSTVTQRCTYHHRPTSSPGHRRTRGHTRPPGQTVADATVVYAEVPAPEASVAVHVQPAASVPTATDAGAVATVPNQRRPYTGVVMGQEPHPVCVTDSAAVYGTGMYYAQSPTATDETPVFSETERSKVAKQ
ncbi:hypothetical protein NESM_000875500 [Novymonas esmeraldas]|uniref:Uncharacterized protein n=1 Tax=Novymonas esmeraldas TaxID=1808958 RepID=A0AAW0EXN9_9TRYP